MLILNNRRLPLQYLSAAEEKAWSGEEPVPPGWLPAAIGSGTIRWIRVGSQFPTAPVFEKWVAALRASLPTPRENETDLCSLAQSVAHLSEVEPAGIIFHVSRCGSTLLSNALSAGENVLALNEASAIDHAMQLAANSGAHKRAGAAALTGLCKAFARYRGSSAQPLVVKTGMAAVARLRAVRSIWPNVPCVMLIREPLEVAISNLQGPPKALLEWYEAPSACFAKVPDEALAGGIAEFCAWAVGRMCSEALEQLDDKCLLLDYRDLTPNAALRVAELFSVRLTDEGRERLRRAFLFDAKRGGEFAPDGDRKKKAAKASLVESVDRWARGPYEDLLRSPWRLQAT